MTSQVPTSGNVDLTDGAHEADVDGYRLEAITSIARLKALLPEWQALIEAAFVPAQCQDPAWVLAAWRHFSDPNDMQTIVIWSPIRPLTESRDMVGMVTLRSAAWRWGMPKGPLKSVVHNHVFDGTPLLHEDFAAGALEALFKQMSESLLFESLPDQGPFLAVLHEAAHAAGRQARRLECFERGVYRCDRPVQDYLEQNHSRSRRYKFRKWRSKLGSAKTLETVHIEPGEDLKPWLAAFFELEARGWKGAEGTAVASSPADSAFFSDALTILHQEGKLMFWKLVLDGKPVSMLFGMRHHRHIGLGKFTYDEDYARYSPGNLLLLDVMDQLTRETETDFIDACGRPGNLMIDALWHERLEVSDFVFSAPGGLKVVFLLQCAAEALRRAVRDRLKPLYQKLKAARRKT